MRPAATVAKVVRVGSDCTPAWKSSTEWLLWELAPPIGLTNHGEVEARAGLVAAHQAGWYASTEFFEKWSNRHPQEVLAAVLAESILRHENDYGTEGHHALKAETVEKLISSRIIDLKGSMARQLELMGAENGEVMRQLAEQGAMLGALLQERGVAPPEGRDPNSVSGWRDANSVIRLSDGQGGAVAPSSLPHRE